jgi:hypothetical protein
MFGNRTADDVNAEVRELAAERARMMQRVDPVVEYWRQQHADFDAHQARFQNERMAEDRRRTEEHEARLRKQAEQEQRRQRDWAARRAELADEVRHLRTEVAAQQGLVLNGDLTVAASAIALRDVLAERLLVAENAYSQHHLAAGFKLSAVPRVGS